MRFFGPPLADASVFIALPVARAYAMRTRSCASEFGAAGAFAKISSSSLVSKALSEIELASLSTDDDEAYFWYHTCDVYGTCRTLRRIKQGTTNAETVKNSPFV